MNHKRKLILFSFVLFFFVVVFSISTTDSYARYVVGDSFSFNLSSAPCDVSVSINSTTGKLESESSQLDFIITIVNNNFYPISYNITGSSDYFKINGNVSNVEVSPNSTVSATISVTAKDNFFYLEESNKANVIVDIISPYSFRADQYELTISTYGYSFNDLIFREYELNKTAPDFTKNITTADGSGIYQAIDESNNYSYYFRGVIEDNYVYFADKYWRLVRINGDGSYRLILDSTIGTSLFFTTTSTTTNNINYNGSTMKTLLEDWYSSNLENYSKYIDINAVFWQDRTVATSSSSLITYAGWDRVTSNTPTLKATNTNDMFTATGATKGNKLLSKPIGLLTSDEYVMAGGSYNSSASPAYFENKNFYLYVDLGSNAVYGSWTLTPRRYSISNNGNSLMVVSKPNAVLYFEPPGVSKRSVRPVINLKSTVKFKGNGTYDDPYFIAE